MPHATLSYSILPPALTASAQSEMDLYISNTGSEPISFPNENSITATEFPGYDDPPQGKDPPFLMVHFLCGTQAAELAPEKEVKNIVFSIIQGGKENWDASYFYSPTVGPYWKICPRKSVSLDAHDSLIFHLSKVPCNAATGSASMYFTFGSGALRQESLLAMPKNSAPSIHSLECLSTNYNIGDKITYRWELANARSCQVYFDGNRIFEGDRCTVPAAWRPYYLRVEDPRSGYIAKQEIRPQFEFIKSFKIAPGGWWHTLKLEWETTCNIVSCSLPGVPKLPSKGSTAFLIKEESDIILSAKIRDSEECVTALLHFAPPVIDAFEVQLVSSSANGPQPEGFLSVEEAFDPDASPLMAQPYAPPGPKPPPTPPLPPKTIHVKWQAHGADSYSICSIPCASSGNQDFTISGSYTSISLQASLIHGYRVEKAVVL